jgi:hypothetical protein
MAARKIVGIVLVILGIVAFVWGGVFWTDTDTVLDAGPLEVQTTEREGFALSPVVGTIALVGGVILLLIPASKRLTRS